MNKRRVLSLLAILLLAGISVFIFRKKIFRENSISDFAVQDTAAITRIFLADKNGHQSTLDKTADGHWRVNNKFDVQESKMQTLMDAIYRVRVKSPVPQKDREDVIKILATSVKVMIYKGEDLLKVYYVGSETADYLGTYMVIENAESPMITEIPGFNGFLTPRFMTREEDWKSNSIVRIRPENLETVSVSYANHPEVSYTIKGSNGNYEVHSLDPSIKVVFNNQQKISEYLQLFSNLSMEGYDNRANKAFNDSLNTSEPLMSINLKEVNGNTSWIHVYLKMLPVGNERIDEYGKATNIDPNRYYAISSTEGRVMVVQAANFGRVMQRFDFFK